jgi:ribosomal protein L17
MKQIRMRSQEISKEIKQEHGISISPEEVENIFIQQWKNNYIPTPDRSVVTKPDERGFFRKAGGGIVGAWTSYNPLKGFAKGYYDERKVETEGGANLGILLPKVPAQQAEQIRDVSEQTEPEEKGKTKKLFEGKEEPAASEQTIIDTTDGSEEAQNKGLDKYKEGYSEEQADYIWDRLSKEEKTQLFRQKYAELVKDGKIDKTEMKYPDYREKAMQMIEDKIIDDLQGRGKEEEEWKSYSYKPVIDIKKGMQMIENKVIDYLKGRGKEE